MSENNLNIKEIIGNLVSAINDKNLKNCLNYVNNGLQLNVNEFLELIKKDKILVSSKYQFKNSELLIKIIDKILKNQEVTAKFKDYLISIKNLNAFSGDIIFMEKFIKETLNKKGYMFFLRVALKIDYIFMQEYFTGDNINSSLKLSDNLDKFSPEEMASALSYISYIYYNDCNHHIKKNYLHITDTEIDKIIFYGIKIKKIHEIEVQIHAFEYHFIINNKKEYIIFSPKENFQKSLNLGYIQNRMQETQSTLDSPHLSSVTVIKDIAKICYKNHKDNFLMQREDNYKRFVFRIEPKPISMYLKLNDKDKLFPHEQIMIEHFLKELMIDEDALLNFNIGVGITFYDLIIFKRYIEFLRWIAYFCIQDNPDINNHFLLSLGFDSNSCQTIFPFFDTEKLRCLLNFLSFDFSSSKSVFDIQYQPILKNKNRFLIFLNIFSESNLIRNSLQLAKKRFYEDGKIDPLTDLLELTFKNKKINVKKTMKYEWNNQKGEIDIIVIFENFVFAFECKNSLLPCSSHEERTSYDYLVTASKQLTRFRNNFVDLNFQEYLEKKLGYPIKGKKLVTCIVMSNRMFLGYRIDGHPVRGSYEIACFLDTGEIAMAGKNIKKEKMCLWKGDELTENDLYDFLENDILHSKLFNSLIEYSQEYILGEKKIIATQYAFDLEKCADNFGFVKAKNYIQNM